jgi:hypothetical protein
MSFMGIASMVLGIVSLVVMFIPGIGIIAIPMSIIGIILGAVGKKQLSAAGQPSGFAVAGIVTGIIALVISAIFSLMCGACAATCASPLMLL